MRRWVFNLGVSMTVLAAAIYIFGIATTADAFMPSVVSLPILIMAVVLIIAGLVMNDG